MCRLPILAIVALGLLLRSGNGEAAAVFTIVDFQPEAPAALEPVHVRVAIEACGRIGPVELVEGVLRVPYVAAADGGVCFAIIQPQLTLGALPGGEYAVELGSYEAQGWRGFDRRTLSVGAGASPAAVDYTGLWWDPQQPARSLQVYSHPQAGVALAAVTAVWLDFDASGRAEWFVFIGEQRVAARFDGRLYRALAPPMALPLSEADLTAVGNASLRFADAQSGEFEGSIDARPLRLSISRYRHR